MGDEQDCSRKVSIFYQNYFSFILEPVWCKKQQKKFLTSYWFVEKGTSEDSEWYMINPG